MVKLGNAIWEMQDVPFPQRFRRFVRVVNRRARRARRQGRLYVRVQPLAVTHVF
jgi:hypothetical protein|tara:strand:+ start:985 stop:1146 length:162 start_codon:yes stop_codon:yes gene_type:complete